MTQRVGATLLVDGLITGNKIGTTAVSTNNIVAGAITGNLIANNSVTSNAIANGAVTNSKLQEPNAFEDYFLLGLGS